MYLYLSSTLCWNYPIPDVLQIAEAFHLDGVEVWIDQIHFHQSTLEEIIEAKKYTNQSLTIHASSWDLNPCALNPELQRSSLKEIEYAMEVGDRLDARNITIHPGKMTIEHVDRKHYIKVLRQNLLRLAEKANQYNVHLSVELMEEKQKELITTPNDMNDLLEGLPDRIRVTFDVAHVPLDVEPNNYYEKLNRINKIHLSDTSKEAYHIALGDGESKLDRIITELKDSHLPIVLEGFDQNPSFPLLKKHLQYVEQKAVLGREALENFSYK